MVWSVSTSPRYDNNNYQPLLPIEIRKRKRKRIKKSYPLWSYPISAEFLTVIEPTTVFPIGGESQLVKEKKQKLVRWRDRKEQQYAEWSRFLNKYLWPIIAPIKQASEIKQLLPNWLKKRKRRQRGRRLTPQYTDWSLLIQQLIKKVTAPIQRNAEYKQLLPYLIKKRKRVKRGRRATTPYTDWSKLIKVFGSFATNNKGNAPYAQHIPRWLKIRKSQARRWVLTNEDLEAYYKYPTLNTNTKTFLLGTTIKAKGETKTFTLGCVTFSATASAGDGDASDWWGESTKLKWLVQKYSLGVSVAFDIEKEIIREKVPHSISLPLQLAVIKKKKIDVGVNTQIVLRGKTSNGVHAHIIIPRSEFMSYGEVIDEKTEIKSSPSPETLRDKDLQYLLSNPDKIRRARNKRLAKLALSLLEDNESLLDDNDE